MMPVNTLQISSSKLAVGRTGYEPRIPTVTVNNPLNNNTAQVLSSTLNMDQMLNIEVTSGGSASIEAQMPQMRGTGSMVNHDIDIEL